MSRYKMIVLVNAAEGQDDEFNTWYNETHLGDILGITDYVAGQRFQAVEGGRTPAHKYVIIYDIETDDIAKVQEEFARKITSGEIPLSPTIDNSNLLLTFVEPITDLIEA